MEIPAFFVVYDRKAVKLTDGRFTNISVSPGERMYEFHKTLGESLDRDYDGPVMMIDCNSFSEREFCEKVMKNMRIRGYEIWFMTYINTVEDVFDAFNKDAELVFAPYHFIDSDAELRDICDVSDSVVPTIFVHKGRAVLHGGRTGDVRDVLEKLVRIGFYRNCILDMDDSLDQYSWTVISEDYPSTIPFLDGGYSKEGFESIITPYLL